MKNHFWGSFGWKWRCRTEPGHQEWDDELWLALDEDDVCLRNIDRLHMRGVRIWIWFMALLLAGNKNATGNRRKGCRCFLQHKYHLRLQILNIQRIDCKHMRFVLPTINQLLSSTSSSQTYFTDIPSFIMPHWLGTMWLWDIFLKHCINPRVLKGNTCITAMALRSSHAFRHATRQPAAVNCYLAAMSNDFGQRGYGQTTLWFQKLSCW